MSLDNDQKQFEERADYIITQDLLKWNVDNDHFKSIQTELRSTSIKLLIGPRGTGKTHQMKIFQESCKDNLDMPLCIYVSFTKYFYLEPYLTKRSYALKIFHSWVLAKLILSCYDLLNDESKINSLLKNNRISFTIDDIVQFISLSERGLIEDESLILKELSILSVINIITQLVSIENRRRCVVLFDDAALTLTQEYMIELFDIIRSIKTKNISPKASVYPGTTEYGPRFHVGHDADEVMCWMNVENESYSDFMNSLVDIRFSDVIEAVPKSILEIFKYASFGIPRAFISLIRNYIKTDGTQQKKFNTSIEKQAEFIHSEYLSLSKRLPQYKRVIEFGDTFFSNSINLLTKVNFELLTKQLVLGIEENSIKANRLLPRMIQLLNEAGLIFDSGIVSHGEGRNYQRYMFHLLFLIKNKAFTSSSKGFNPTDILSRVKSKSEKHPVRKQLSQLVDINKITDLKLDFPPCSNCGSFRLTDEQLFCHICGKELIKFSVFEQCLKIPVAQIGLTSWQKQKMIENNYTCIEDFISKKEPASSLREIHGIGAKKATSITSNVEKFISEYLS